MLIWINEKQVAGDNTSEAMTCEKAKMPHADLLKDTPGMSTGKSDSFKATRGCGSINLRKEETFIV